MSLSTIANRNAVRWISIGQKAPVAIKGSPGKPQLAGGPNWSMETITESYPVSVFQYLGV